MRLHYTAPSVNAYSLDYSRPSGTGTCGQCLFRGSNGRVYEEGENDVGEHMGQAIDH